MMTDVTGAAGNTVGSIMDEYPSVYNVASAERKV